MQPESAETLLKRHAKRNFWLNVLVLQLYLW
jgi:hypothetical protein